MRNSLTGIVKTAMVLIAGGLCLSHSAQAAPRKQTIHVCRATCITLDSGRQEIRLGGQIEGQAPSREDAYEELKATCSAIADRWGMPESALARGRVSMSAIRSNSSSSAWRKQEGDFSYRSGHVERASEREGGYDEGFWRDRTWERSYRYDARSFARARASFSVDVGSTASSSSSAMTLSFEPADDEDLICKRRRVSRDWVPYYHPLPGSQQPRG
jgi:hypothetical protein